MNDTKETTGALAVPAEDIDRLLACADGVSALLYLHILRSGGFSLTGAARILRTSEESVMLAYDNLRRLGLVRAEKPLAPAEELPQYTAQDISQRASSDPEFEGVVFEAQQALGKLLSTNDLRILFGIYDHLGLPAEVIVLLINHCVETYQQRNGAGRMPTMRYIEKEAWFWAGNEIISLDAAEEHIRRDKQRAEAAQQVKELLQIRGRELTPSERKYIDSWLSLGYSPEALAIAYDRTVIGTGRLAWKYMDRIIQAWREKGLFTPEDIEKGDARAPHRPARQALPAQDAGREIENMRRLYESMEKGK
jgi:hypothetical protein